MNISFQDVDLIYAASSGHNYSHNVKEKASVVFFFSLIPPTPPVMRVTANC